MSDTTLPKVIISSIVGLLVFFIVLLDKAPVEIALTLPLGSVFMVWKLMSDYEIDLKERKRISNRPRDSDLVEKLVSVLVVEDLVEPTALERIEMMALIKRTMSGVNIKDVKKVKNSFLEAMYKIKKEEYKCRNSYVEEKELIHVTGVSNVKSIISNNFDWRRITRGKFGLGTSFSGDAEYANKYANERIGWERAFIVSKVLVSQSTEGSFGMKVPPLKCDTAVGNRNKVYVKFHDHEVLPQFVLYYEY